jgi:GAF domain-containing protein
MWERLKRFLAPPVFEGDEDKTRTARVLNTVTWVSISAMIVGVIPVLFRETILLPLLSLSSSAVILGLTIYLTRSGRVRAASWLYSMTTWMIGGVLMVVSGGLSSPMVSSLFSSILMAGLLVGAQGAVVVAVLSVASVGGVGIAQSLGVLPQAMILDSVVGQLIVILMNIVLSTVLFYFASNSLVEFLGRARRSAAEAETQREQVQILLNERGDELARREAYLGAATEIAAEVAAVERDPLMLLRQAAMIISRQFGFYHTAFFLLDDNRQWAVLQAASSEGGQRMLQSHLRLRVGAEGIVGAVAAHGQYRIAQNVGEDEYFFRNPNLLETRSEIALPLRVRREVVGVLDVQSDTPNDFTDEDVNVLQALADQVSVAVSNARLLRQVEESFAAARQAYGQMARETWQELLRARPDLAFASDEDGIAPFMAWEPQMKAAAHSGQAAGEGDTLALPIRVRDQVIGVIDGRKPDGSTWSAEEITLLQTLTEQLSTALEGAQLYEDTQRRAAREQLAREITAEMRRSLEVTTVLQTALYQLRTSLGLTEAEVWIEEESSDAPAASPPPGGITGGMQ